MALIGSEPDINPLCPMQTSCGSKLARDEAGTFNNDVD
jgi:hypothetical protein